MSPIILPTIQSRLTAQEIQTTRQVSQLFELLQKAFRWFENQIRSRLAMLLIASCLAACSTTTRLVDHGFEFDIRSKDATVEIMDYRYGSSDITGTRRPEWTKGAGRPSGSTRVYGA